MGRYSKVASPLSAEEVGGGESRPRRPSVPARVLEWKHVEESAAVTDFMGLGRMNPDHPKKGAKACPHSTRCEQCALTLALNTYFIGCCALIGCSN